MATHNRSTSLLSSNDRLTSSPNTSTPSTSTDATLGSAERSLQPGQRNVIRKRRSFFGRSNSDVASMQPGAMLQATLSSLTVDGSNAPNRPPTAMSESRRRKTEPLRTVRDSIFGGRKKSTDREASEPQPTNPTWRSVPGRSGPEIFEADHYRHVRKTSISPPFNFQHITHTTKQHLPPLETVDEVRLPAEFWTNAAYQRPRRHLSGIRADDLAEKHAQMGIAKGSPSSRPKSPLSPTSGQTAPGAVSVVSSINETLFDETNETRFNHSEALQRLHPSIKSPPRHPRRRSSLGALKYGGATPPQLTQSREASMTSCGQSNASPHSETLSQSPVRLGSDQFLNQDASCAILMLGSVKEESEPAGSRRHSRQSICLYSCEESSSSGDASPVSLSSDDVSKVLDQAHPAARQLESGSATTQLGVALKKNQLSFPATIGSPPQSPLPPLPLAAKIPKVTESPVKAGKRKNSATDSNMPAQDRVPSAKSNKSAKSAKLAKSTKSTKSSKSSKSKRSYRSARLSPAATMPSNDRTPTKISDGTWEDDVDFCYQQEAESTCDFDWACTTAVREASIAASERDVRLSAWLAPSPASAVSTETAATSLKPSESSDSIVKQASVGDVKASHHRGFSVGHRGFLAARRNSADFNRNAPSPLELSSGSTEGTVLSPVFSVTGSEHSTPTTPHPPSVTESMPLSKPDRASADSMSDPESVRTGGSKHRKSSSFGSYESFVRTRPASAIDSARWSIVSSTSVPDLLHSRRRHSRNLHKNMISRPLESLPQSPGSGSGGETNHGQKGRGEDGSIVPPERQTVPMRNNFIMRRPQSPEDRAILQSAGSAARRGRPATSTRFSRPARSAKHVTHAPGWI